MTKKLYEAAIGAMPPHDDRCGCDNCFDNYDEHIQIIGTGDWGCGLCGCKKYVERDCHLERTGSQWVKDLETGLDLLKCSGCGELWDPEFATDAANRLCQDCTA